MIEEQAESKDGKRSQKNLKGTLQDNEEQFRLFVSSVKDYAIFQMDLQGTVITWNPGVGHLLGYAEDDFIGIPASQLFTPEDTAINEAQIEIETARTAGRAEDERWHVRKDGSRFFASGILTAVYDDARQLQGFAKIMRDVTERKVAEEQIRLSLREKDTLLKEVHHRVKNNLQLITSLLKLQSEHIKDGEALRLMEEMYGRIHSIAATHELLYQSDHLAQLNFGEYLQKITRDLFGFYKVDFQKVKLQTEIRSADLNITQAVPCGLIVNELVTNCLKHAFPNSQAGLLRVSLEGDEEQFLLTVEDNGVGLPENVDPYQTSSMGLQLVNLLVEQLQGTMTFDRSAGAKFSILFSAREV